MYVETGPDRGGLPGSTPRDAEGGLMRTIRLRDIWAPIYRSRWGIIAIWVAVLALAVVVTMLTTPIYRARATVEIRQEAQKVVGTEDTSSETGAAWDIDRFLDTQLDIVRSRSTATAVAESLGLYRGSAFLNAMGQEDVAGATPVLTREEAHRMAVEGALMSGLRVNLSKDTRIARIEFSSPDPRLSERIANSYADNYIRMSLERRFDASRYSLDFLRNQLREAQVRLADSEREALAYARRSRLIDASAAGSGATATAPRSLTTASLVDLNAALSQATARRISAQQRWDKVRTTEPLQVTEVLANPAVQELVQQLAQLRSIQEGQKQTRRDDYPAVQQGAARIDELNGEIARLADNIRATLRTEYETALRQENAIRRDLEGLKDETLDEQARTIRLSILQREANTDRVQLDVLLNRYNQINAQAGVQLNNLSIIDRAPVPTSPYWPSVTLNLALAILIAGALSTLFVLGRENLFEMVRSPDDVRERLGVPLLGAVPVGGDVLAELANPKTGVAEAFSSIRASLALSSGEGVPGLFMVTSTQAGEGKSTACYGIATGLAKTGRSVVVVDADLRRPNTHRQFGVENGAGVSTVLSGNMPVEQAVTRGVAPNVDLLAAGPIPPNPAELLATGALGPMLAALAERYDHVIVDSAPVLGLADAPLIAAHVAGIVYVVEATRTSVRGALSALGRVAQSGTPVLGVILSRFHPGRAGYGYDYRYAYDYSYQDRG